jgi:hypothetical protein
MKIGMGTIVAILTGAASFVGVLAYYDQRIRYNKARTKAQQGRITALVQIINLQGRRITVVENYLAKEDSNNYQVNTELIELEKEFLEEYKTHDTKLT